ncbi:MAG TPA: hypothetical protein VGP04_03050, partial [Pseudonocardiaceae bacterium]|nr:hypothetical protein [Pseudonocardiaceae bacterium]
DELIARIHRAADWPPPAYWRRSVRPDPDRPRMTWPAHVDEPAGVTSSRIWSATAASDRLR